MFFVLKAIKLSAARLGAALFALFLLARADGAVTVIRVDNNDGVPSPAGLGSAWDDDAYQFLQDGISRAQTVLALAEPGDTVQLWVADGLYVPDQSDADEDGTGDRKASFELHENIEIYAGFAGNEPAGDEGFRARNCYTNLCTLFGGVDLTESTTDNSFHVVRAQSVDATAILDGFIIIGGYATDELAEDAPYDEVPQGYGGGMLLAVTDAGQSGDICTPTILRCRFWANHAVRGGGVLLGANQGNPPFFVNCEFLENTATEGGGGFYNMSIDEGIGGFPHLVNCLFSYNTSVEEGAGLRHGLYGEPCVINCTFYENVTQAEEGGGIFNERTFNSGTLGQNAISLRNTILWHNVSYDGSTPETDGEAQLVGYITIINCCVEGGLAHYPTDYCDDCIDDDPLFIDADGTNNSEGDLDDNFRIPSNSPCVDAAGTAPGAGVYPYDTYDLDQMGLSGCLNQLTPDMRDERRRNENTYFDMGAHEYHPPSDPCDADINNSGIVDIDDLFIVIMDWGICPFLPIPCPGDVVAECDNSVVNIDDLFFIIGAWGEHCPGYTSGEAAGLPEDWEDCEELCTGLYPDINTEEWGDCMCLCLVVAELIDEKDCDE